MLRDCSMINFYSELVYHRLEVCISPERDVCIDGWLGAVIRNNLLYAAEQVKTGEGISLLSKIGRLSLAEDHPWYKSLSGGFPKGFSLSVVYPEKIYTSRLFLHKDEKLVFALVLVGELVCYYKEFIAAIRSMCARGMGVSMVAFTLQEIYETDGFGRKQRIAVGYSDTVAALRYPVRLADFEEEHFGCREKKIRLHLTAPVSLVNRTEKKNKTISYQDKLNGFPSFYQLVRSAAYRCVKLTALYACPREKEAALRAEKEIEAYMDNAASAWLEQAEVQWVSMRGPKRDDGRLPVVVAGYVGDLIFSGDFQEYVPLLSFMQFLGVGNDTVYGAGTYRLEVLKYSEPQENSF